MKPVLFYSTLVVVALGCTSEDNLSQPTAPGEPLAAAAAGAANSWSTQAAYPGMARKQGSLAMAPNAAGQSMVYYLGGYDGRPGGTPVEAYNVTTNAWTTKMARVNRWLSNGAGKIGSK